MKKVRKSSPCVNICKINSENGLCIGCFRNLEEIARWSQLDEVEKGKIYSEISRRKMKISGNSVNVY